MADPAPIAKTNDGPTLAVEPSPVLASTPVSPAPAAAPVAATAAPASADASSLSPPPEAGATAEAPAAAKVVLPSEVPTLLEESTLEGKKAEEPKPAEPEKKADAAKPEEPKAPEPAKPVDPVAYKYELPESIKMDDTQRGDFHKAMDGLRADPVAGAQGLIDLHNQVMSKAMEDVRRQQYETFNDVRAKWQDQVRADEELGGAGFETTMRAVARMRDLFVPANRRAAFDEALRVTGAGDHPEIIRMLHTAARFFDEPRMPPPNPKPPANIGRTPGKRGTADLYPNTNFKS